MTVVNKTRTTCRAGTFAVSSWSKVWDVEGVTPLALLPNESEAGVNVDSSPRCGVVFPFVPSPITSPSAAEAAFVRSVQPPSWPMTTLPADGRVDAQQDALVCGAWSPGGVLALRGHVTLSFST